MEILAKIYLFLFCVGCLGTGLFTLSLRDYVKTNHIKVVKVSPTARLVDTALLIIQLFLLQGILLLLFLMTSDVESRNKVYRTTIGKHNKAYEVKDNGNV